MEFCLVLECAWKTIRGLSHLFTQPNFENKTPEGFIIAARIPQEITNEQCLLECDGEFARFAENPLTQ